MLFSSIRKCYGLFLCWHFYPQYLTNGNFSLLTIPFCEGTWKDLSGALDYFANIVSNLLLSSAENTKKWAAFDILMIMTLAVNVITRQVTPIFLIYSLSSIHWDISFLHFNSFLWSSPFCIILSSVNYPFT